MGKKEKKRAVHSNSQAYININDVNSDPLSIDTIKAEKTNKPGTGPLHHMKILNKIWNI